MTTPSSSTPVRRAVVPLLRVVLAVQAARLALAVVAGVAASTQHAPGGGFGVGSFENGPERLTDFADAGDGIGALLMLLAVVLLWASANVVTLPNQRRRWHIDRTATLWLLAITGVSSVLLAVGYLWAAADADFFPASQEIRLVGSAVVWAGALAGALYVTRGMSLAQTAVGDDELDGEPGAAVFAVDRKTGAVLAWPSVQEARQKAPLYGVEDDEYDWYLDDGVVIAAAAVGGDVQLTPTPDARPDELLRDLTAHAERRGLVVDEPDEPLAYVDPIVKDNYLEMWPGWLRWIGRLVR